MADENASIITPDEFLFLGLKLVGYKDVGSVVPRKRPTSIVS
jgi:hypothetical protein